MLLEKDHYNECLNYLKEGEELVRVFRSDKLKRWCAVVYCPKHGEYTVSKSNMKRGSGCPGCKAEKTSKRLISSKDKVVNDFKKCLYDNEKLIDVYKKQTNKGIKWYGIIEKEDGEKYEIYKSNIEKRLA